MKKRIFLLTIILFVSLMLFKQNSVWASPGQEFNHPVLDYSIEIPLKWKLKSLKETPNVIMLSPQATIKLDSLRVTLTVLEDRNKLPRDKKELTFAVTQYVGPKSMLPHVTKLKVLDMGFLKRQGRGGFSYKMEYILKMDENSKEIRMFAMNHVYQVGKFMVDLSLEGPVAQFQKAITEWKNIENSFFRLNDERRWKKSHKE